MRQGFGGGSEVVEPARDLGLVPRDRPLRGGALLLDGGLEPVDPLPGLPEQVVPAAVPRASRSARSATATARKATATARWTARDLLTAAPFVRSAPAFP